MVELVIDFERYFLRSQCSCMMAAKWRKSARFQRLSWGGGCADNTIHSAAFPLLCDDVVGLELPTDRSQPPIARVGYGSIKLVPDAVRHVLQREPEELSQVSPELFDPENSEVNKRHFVASLARVLKESGICSAASS